LIHIFYSLNKYRASKHLFIEASASKTYISPKTLRHAFFTKMEKISVKNFTFTFLLISALFSIVFAQSGRRVRTTTVSPAPQPTEIQLTQQLEDNGGYSDSVPDRVQLSKDQPPKLQGARNKNDKDAGNTKNQTDTATQTSGSEATGEDEVLRIDTNLVTIPVSVLDRNGMYIADLQKQSFKIFENGIEQEIAYFGTTEQPFTVVLLLDTSSSAKYKIEEIQEAAISFVNKLKSQDTVMVISFDNGVDVLAEPTNDRETLYKAIRRAKFGGATSLYDAVDFTLRKRLNKITGRKAVVLFTDGVDTSSRTTYNSTLRIVEEADSTIFPVYYDTYGDNGSNGGLMSSPYPPGMSMPIPGTGGIRVGNSGASSREEYEIGKRYLRELALRTGGRVYYAKWQPRGLEEAFANIAEELRLQYSIGYYPQDAGQNGQRKQIKVRVFRPHLVVRARDSYVVGAKENIPAGQKKSSK
jgi:VWFA-related protein